MSVEAIDLRGIKIPTRKYGSRAVFNISRTVEQVVLDNLSETARLSRKDPMEEIKMWHHAGMPTPKGK